MDDGPSMYTPQSSFDIDPDGAWPESLQDLDGHRSSDDEYGEWWEAYEFEPSDYIEGTMASLCPFGSPSASFLTPDVDGQLNSFELDAQTYDSPRGYRSFAEEFEMDSAELNEDAIELSALRMVRRYVKSITQLSQRKTKGFRETIAEQAAKQRRKIENRMHTLESQLKTGFERATSTPLKNFRNGLRQRVKRTGEKMQREVDEIADKYKPKLRKMITGDEETKVRVHLKQPKVVRMMDRISFFVSVNLMMFAQYFTIVHPSLFRYYYCVAWCILFPTRVYMYYNLKYLGFMLDFCYFVQPLTLTLAFVLPDSKVLFYVCYSFAFGPLAVAIILWRNSLVFHDVDKVTSVFIHMMPPLVMHCLHWSTDFYSQPEFAVTGFAEALRYFIGYPILVYLLWQLGYLLVTEVLLKSYLVRNPDQQTSLRWLGTDRKFVLYVLCTRIFKNKLGFLGPDEHLSDLSAKSLFVFVFTQLVFTMCTMLVPALLYLGGRQASVVWLCFLFMCVTWNGASFYIEVFSRRYAPKAFATTVNSSNKGSADAKNALVDPSKTSADSKSPRVKTSPDPKSVKPSKIKSMDF